MAVIIDVSEVRRRNVKTRSSILHADQTRCCDCSGMALPPEDGQFITVADGVGTVGTGVLYKAATLAALTCTEIQGSGLHMVWGHAMRSDFQVTGYRAHPYFNKYQEVDVGIYEAPDNSLALNHADNFPAGAVVTVISSTNTIEGGTRLVLSPMIPTEACWAVGVVTYSPSDTPAPGKRIRVRLYAEPRLVSPT